MYLSSFLLLSTINEDTDTLTLSFIAHLRLTSRIAE